MNPRISVIVPVYGVEAYLRDCVDSILRQTYEAFELILVDDGSPDGCPALCDAYAEKDARVRVIHRENGGLSRARNAGLDAAAGDYVSFVDGDDVIAPRFLERLLSPGADIAQCGFRTDGAAALAEGGPFEPVDGREMARRMCLDGRGDYTVVWNKLWRRELIEALRFPPGKRHEDEFFSWRAYWDAAACVVTDAPMYYYRQRPESIMGEGFSPKSLHAVEALSQRADFYRAAGDGELSVLTQAVLCHRLRGMMKDIRRAMPEDGERYESLLRNAYRSVMGSERVAPKKKLSLTLQMLSPALYRALGG